MERAARTDNNGKAFRGSQFQFQTYVNQHRELLQEELAVLFADQTSKLDWRSPLSEDNYKEYRDTEFLRKLSLCTWRKACATFGLRVVLFGTDWQ
jgi:hypothetical protein